VHFGLEAEQYDDDRRRFDCKQSYDGDVVLDLRTNVFLKHRQLTTSTTTTRLSISDDFRHSLTGRQYKLADVKSANDHTPTFFYLMHVECLSA